MKTIQATIADLICMDLTGYEIIISAGVVNYSRPIILNQ